MDLESQLKTATTSPPNESLSLEVSSLRSQLNDLQVCLYSLLFSSLTVILKKHAYNEKCNELNRCLDENASLRQYQAQHHLAPSSDDELQRVKEENARLQSLCKQADDEISSMRRDLQNALEENAIAVRHYQEKVAELSALNYRLESEQAAVKSAKQEHMKAIQVLFFL